MRESKEKLLSDRDNMAIKLSVLESQRRLVQRWLKAVKGLHQPYSRALDLSCSKPEDMKAALLKRLEGDLWCNECSNHWPCRRLEQLQVLDDILRGRDNGAEALDALNTRIHELTPHERPGLLPVRM